MHPYEEIRTEMLRRIGSQEWPTGHLLPHENDLAAEFGVARGTVRRAMGDLVQQGLLERRRKAGTRVSGTSTHNSTLVILVVRKEVVDAGKEYSYRLILLERGEAERGVRDYFGKGPLLHVQCLHLADGQPYQLEDRLINLGAVPEAERQDFSKVSPNEWLLSRVPCSAVRTVLRAEPSGPDAAKHLDIDLNDPIFVIERQTRYNGKAITFVRMSHPYRTFRIVTQTGDFETDR